MRIGIDVGGTNTDAVLMDGDRVVEAIKSSTSPDVTSGIRGALAELLKRSAVAPAAISAVMIGTTHFINALVEGRDLAPTVALRLGLPATRGLPPMVGWPPALVSAMRGQQFMSFGGHEFDGRVISDFDEKAVREILNKARDNGATSIAVSSVFSPINGEHEQRVAELAAREFPGMSVSLSHQIGRVGLLERENATILNAALRDLADTICSSLDQALRDLSIVNAALYLSQNDGTLMDVEFARRYPVATFASGATNSMRGAAVLSGLSDCVVVDVGGTTSDVGVLQSGFPREAATEVEVGGVRTNFRMPDVLSIGLGGGSRIRGSAGALTVGPDSVGYRITQDALVFGGNTLTATDIVVAAGRAELGDPSRVRSLSRADVAVAMEQMARMLESAIDRVRVSANRVPVVAVGGGSILVPDSLSSASEIVKPQHFSVANAIGAAIAQVGGEVDRVFAVGPGQRSTVLDQARQEAFDKAVAAGATAESTRIVDVDELPLAYLPGNAVRIRVKAVGDLPTAVPAEGN